MRRDLTVAQVVVGTKADLHRVDLPHEEIEATVGGWLVGGWVVGGWVVGRWWVGGWLVGGWVAFHQHKIKHIYKLKFQSFLKVCLKSTLKISIQVHLNNNNCFLSLVSLFIKTNMYALGSKCVFSSGNIYQ